MRRALEGYDGGIIVNGKVLNNLRYADDTTLIAKNEEEMATMLKLVTKESRPRDQPREDQTHVD